MRKNGQRTSTTFLIVLLVLTVIALVFTLMYILSMDNRSVPKIKRASIEENYHEPVKFYPTFESKWKDRLSEAEIKETSPDEKGYPDNANNSNKITSNDEGYPNGDDWSEKGKAIAEDLTEFLMDIPW